MSELVTVNRIKDPISCMVFSLHDRWIVKLTDKGFEFNFEAFPEGTPEVFAKEFVQLCREIWNEQNLIVEKNK